MGPTRDSVPAANGEDLVVLIAGSDAIADAVSTALAARGADVQQLSAALATDAIVAAVPDAVLLVGDAARQRGALIRSQLVRRMRGTEINLVVLIDGVATLSPNNAVRLVSRTNGAEAIADQLMSLAETSLASRTKGTLDQVASMVTEALERPSQPAPAASAPASPSHIVMKSGRAPAAAARATLRVAGAIPAPARTVPASSASLPAPQLLLAPPTSLQALAAKRVEITRVNNPPPPLPGPTEVSLADMRIETDRVSGEVTLGRSVPPLPIARRSEPAIVTPHFQTAAATPITPSVAPHNASVAPAAIDAGSAFRENPTPVAWSPSEVLELRASTRRFSKRHATLAAAFAIAACAGLIAWKTADVHGEQTATANGAPTTATTVATTPTAAPRGASATANTAKHTARVHENAEAIDDATDEQMLVAAAAMADEPTDEEDPAGDEPHMVRARQLCNEGHALRTRGRLGLAEAKYLQALGLFPQYPRAIAGVVRVHLTRGDGAEAVRWAERLITMQPNRSNNQLLLGDAYALSGKANDARRHWLKSASFGNMAARKRLKADDVALAKPTR